MTSTETTEAERLRRWAHLHGYDAVQAQAIATDPAAHRAALAAWFEGRGLDPAQTQEEAAPPDPVLLAEWGTTQGVEPNTAQVWASTHESFPAPRLVAAPAPGGPVGRRPGVYALAELEQWQLPQRAARIDPGQFSPEERVSVAEFAQRTGKDRSTLSKAVNNPAYRNEESAVRAPERGADRKYDARELAEFVNSLPGRRGRQAKKGRS